VRGSDILDELVSAQVDESSQRQADSARTFEAESVEVEADHDAGLLEKLTKSSSEPEETDITSVAEPVEMAVEADEDVKQDVLDELTGRSEAEDAPSDKPSAGQPGEGEDA
jgi:hypothetical protein